LKSIKFKNKKLNDLSFDPIPSLSSSLARNGSSLQGQIVQYTLK